MSDTRRIGLWDSYQMMANPLVIEDENEWRELTVSDLVSILMNVAKETNG